MPELSLFPLNVVLFPGMPLPLHIFEERYRTMIGECIVREEPFGVVLIKEGPEVGGPAEPFKVGTTANIVQVERQEDGRMNILTEGRRRFNIVEFTQRSPYLKGLVEYLEERTGDPPEESVSQARNLFSEYMQCMAGLRGGWVSEGKAPSHVEALSYAIAHFIDLRPHVRQRLLEAGTVKERLDQELPLLRERYEALRRELVRRTPFRGFRLN